MSNENLRTCNLPNLQRVCARRFPNIVVKIGLHLDPQSMPVTSKELGEEHKPSRGKGKILKTKPLQSPDGGHEK